MAAPATRYARGQQRRDALIAAAADLLLEHGLGALSHRAVATRAGLPLASTTYYFASAEDLRDEALQHLADTWVVRAQEVVDRLPDDLGVDLAAQAVAQIIGADESSARMLLMYERYLDAGRHPRLRPVVVAWNARLEHLVHRVLTRAGLAPDPGAPRLVLAVADGTAVTALAEGSSVQEAVTGSVHRLLSLLRETQGGSTGPGGLDPWRDSSTHPDL
ncbi:TetR/AcrR family transcriptional regulator [Cellulomonas endophytica]|uniref:TetR/AcrR family transcriptional regulator n=1 Tax=Cellulomonas endophytica TaxID=2494735 RepID=UPI0013E8FAD3|nr:TetR family transcriptional regulator [Cellulomonas endophytica]